MVYQTRIGIIKASVKNIGSDGIPVEMDRFGLAEDAVVEPAEATLRSIESMMD